MLTLPARKDRIAVLKKEYGIGGVSGSLKNGGHRRINYNGSGFDIEYKSDGIDFHEHLTWEKVEARILQFIQQDSYLTAKEKAELEAGGKLVSLDAPSVLTEPSSQLNLFEVFSQPQDIYEATGGEDNDALLNESSTEPEPLPFQEGDRIYYHDKVFEILKFMHDGRTVEIGDISQLQNLTKFAIRERVPISEIADCKLLKDHYTDGEIASMVVDAVQNGDNSEETKEEINAATLVNQANEDYNRAVMEDFHKRTMDFHYRYSPDHHLYEGGQKTKCCNNIEAIRLLKDLQSQGRMTTAEEQITLARFVG